MECRKDEDGFGWGSIIGWFLLAAFVISLFFLKPGQDNTYEREKARISWQVRNDLCKINIAMNGTAYKC